MRWSGWMRYPFGVRAMVGLVLVSGEPIHLAGGGKHGSVPGSRETPIPRRRWLPPSPRIPLASVTALLLTGRIHRAGSIGGFWYHFGVDREDGLGAACKLERYVREGHNAAIRMS